MTHFDNKEFWDTIKFWRSDKFNNFRIKKGIENTPKK